MSVRDRGSGIHPSSTDGLAIRVRRLDTDEAVTVTYHIGDVPDAGPTSQHLPALIEGTATAADRAAFSEAWHGRVQAVLTDDALFTVEPD